jgi:uncharacterized protein YprB with RNaseH-like and TPR domain
MASDDRRKRLDALNREPLPEAPHRAGESSEVAALRRKLERRRNGSPTPPAAAPVAPAARPAKPSSRIVYRRSLPPASAKPGASGPLPDSRESVSLETAAPGVELPGRTGGSLYLISTAVAKLDEGVEAVDAAYHAALGDARSPARRWIAARCQLEHARPEDLVFLDLETTGLGSTPLFLIGAMKWEESGLVVRQYFARSYAEERAVLERFLADVADQPLLVSFNGKSFDLPYVRVRSAATGVPFRIAPAHLDLLHVSRRIWRGRLPDCKLQTLERAVCGRMRAGDIPGSEIPQAYHDFVRTGDARQMVTCLHHNLLDLVTLADLMTRMPGPEAPR